MTNNRQFKLIGSKIILRELKNSDAESIYQNANNKEIALYTDIPYPYSIKKVRLFIKKVKREIKNKTGYQFGIELLDKKGIIGIIGLTNIDYKHKKTEIEYWLGKKYWRQSIMREAGNLLLAFGFKKLKLNRIYAKAIPANVASWKLLESLGFFREGILREALFEKGKWVNLLIYSLLKKEHFKKLR